MVWTCPLHDPEHHPTIRVIDSRSHISGTCAGTRGAIQVGRLVLLLRDGQQGRHEMTIETPVPCPQESGYGDPGLAQAGSLEPVQGVDPDAPEMSFAGRYRIEGETEATVYLPPMGQEYGR